MTQTPLFEDIKPAQRPDSKGQIYVYCIENTVSRHLKVGIALNVAERLRNLQTGSAAPLRLIACREGSRADERFLHEVCDRFKARISGEWFRPIPRVLAAIAMFMRRDEWASTLGGAFLNEAEIQRFEMLIGLAEEEDERQALRDAYAGLQQKRWFVGARRLIQDTFQVKAIELEDLAGIKESSISQELRDISLEADFMGALVEYSSVSGFAPFDYTHIEVRCDEA